MNGIMRKLFVITAAGLMLATLACVSGPGDDPSRPDVVLEVDITQSPAITAQDQGGVCEIKITEWSVNFTNVPKNSLATTSPWNDIEIVSIEISYDFPDVAVSIPTRDLPSPGTVPADASLSLKFDPILFQDLVNNPQVLGTSGILTMTVHARLIDGQRIDKTIGEVLNIEQCV